MSEPDRTRRRLSEVTTSLNSRRRPVKSTERQSGPYRYYGASGVVDYVDAFLFEGLHLLVAEDGENLRSRNTPIAFLADGQFWVNNHAHVLIGNDFGDTRYLSYAVEQLDLSGYLTGSTQPKLTKGALDSIVIDLPPLPEQQAIAEVLGALDDKIAANTAVAATATHLATTEFTAAARSATWGPTFDQLADVSGGGTPSTRNATFWDGEIWWATPTDMTALAGPYLESTARTITTSGLAACSSKLFEPGAILMTSRATIGTLAVNSIPTALNQGFIVVEPHDPSMRWWLFHEMESRVNEFISWANGATFLELSRGNFRKLPVRIPSAEALSAFAKSVEALHGAASGLLTENRTLAATRDALLPQLMSGKLRVRDAEQLAADAGA